MICFLFHWDEVIRTAIIKASSFFTSHPCYLRSTSMTDHHLLTFWKNAKLDEELDVGRCFKKWDWKRQVTFPPDSKRNIVPCCFSTNNTSVTCEWYVSLLLFLLLL